MATTADIALAIELAMDMGFWCAGETLDNEYIVTGYPDTPTSRHMCIALNMMEIDKVVEEATVDAAKFAISDRIDGKATLGIYLRHRNGYWPSAQDREQFWKNYIRELREHG